MARRISLGPADAASYLANLKVGFDVLGVPSEHFMFTDYNKFSYNESDYFLRGAYRASVKIASFGRFAKLIATFLEKLLRFIALIYAIIRCDVFIFVGFGSFFRFLELPLLRALGKKVMVVYLGSDARPPYLSGKHLDDRSGCFDARAVHREAQRQLRLIRRAERHATAIINHTGTAQYFEKPFVRLGAVGSPMVSKPDVDGLPRDAGKIRIVHAPSRPRAKGTDLVRAIVAKLQGEGAPLELMELVGVPNSQVLRALKSCDFVVDEIYSDMPMAMLAAEAATFAKPVVVGSYYVDDYFRDNPDDRTPPAMFVHPDRIEDAVRALIEDRERRVALGAAARDFQQERWRPEVVAGNYLRVANGDVPSHWWCDPQNVRYSMGWGLNVPNWRTQMRAYLRALGEDGLLLRNMGLRRAIVEQVRASGESDA